MKTVEFCNFYGPTLCLFKMDLHCKPSQLPVMKTGFSLCSFSLQGKPRFVVSFFYVTNTNARQQIELDQTS